MYLVGLLPERHGAVHAEELHFGYNVCIGNVMDVCVCQCIKNNPSLYSDSTHTHTHTHTHTPKNTCLVEEGRRGEPEPVARVEAPVRVQQIDLEDPRPLLPRLPQVPPREEAGQLCLSSFVVRCCGGCKGVGDWGDVAAL